MSASATVLQDGKVLIVGGDNADGAAVATAELYDPSTGKFIPTGMMNEARDSAAMSLLPDGRVLIAGGNGCDALICLYQWSMGPGSPVDTAELYDPTTGKFTRTGSMSDVSVAESATLLPDGRVLVILGGMAGDEIGSGLWSNVADVYDPKTGKFTPTGPGLPLDSPTSTLLPNGEVLVTGELLGSDPAAELYDPASATFSTVPWQGSTPETATLLRDGRVLLFDSGYLAIYDPKTAVFTPGGLMPGGGDWQSPNAVPLENGTVLFESYEATYSESDPDSDISDIALGVYDPVSGPHAMAAKGPDLEQSSVALLKDGRVLIAGGGVGDYTGDSDAELLTITWPSSPSANPSAAPSASATASANATATPISGGMFQVTGSTLSHIGGGATSTLLTDGRVLVAGGYQPESADPQASAETFDPGTGLWSKTGSMADARVGHTATLLENGKVLVAGCAGRTAELYDPATGKFALTGAMPVSTCHQTATLLHDGRVLLAGGVDGETYLRTVEIYDPATGKFSTTGSMRVEREDAQAVLLPDGRVLLAGGDQGDSIMYAVFLNSAEVYDPAAGKFTSTGNMKETRTQFSSVLLPNGKVVVAGGNAHMGTAETYDTADGKFARWDSLAAAGGKDLTDVWMIQLHDGRVLISGSVDSGIPSVLYDPTSGLFSRTAPLPAGGGSPAVTLLDGRVLIPGNPSLLYLP